MIKIVAGEYRGRKLQTPKGSTTRPSSGGFREMVFNLLQGQLEDVRFLDLFAGSGAMGLEALSRGALHCTLVDSHPAALRCIRENVQALGVESQAAVVKMDVLKALKRSWPPFDIIFCDPPYNQGWSHKVLQELDQGNLLAEGGVLLIEEAAGVDLAKVPLEHLELADCRKRGSSQIWRYRRA